MRRPINLAGIDLNLLVAFEALIDARNVSRAAAKVGLSQPSMSHSLKRLRELFSDELFRRCPGGMEPSTKALEVALLVTPALAKLRQALSGQAGFDPATAERHFVIGMSDIGSFETLPLLMPSLRTQAPHIDLTIADLQPTEAAKKLHLGEIDLALNVFPDLPRDLFSEPLSTLESVCLVDRRNPHLRDGHLDAETFLMLPHVSIGAATATVTPPEFELNALGFRRRIALRVPHFLAIPGAIIGTDMVAVFDSHIAQAFAGWPHLAIVPTPLPLSPVSALMVWHARSNEDPGHVWLRQLLQHVHQQAGHGSPAERRMGSL